MGNSNPQNHRTRYKSKTLPPDTELAKKAIGVKLPVGIDKYVRSLPDISGFVRQSIIEKLERDAKLPLPEVAIAPMPTVEAIPKKPRVKKPEWIFGGVLQNNKLLPESDRQLLQDNPDCFVLIDEPKTKATRILDIRNKGTKKIVRGEGN